MSYREAVYLWFHWNRKPEFDEDERYQWDVEVRVDCTVHSIQNLTLDWEMNSVFIRDYRPRDPVLAGPFRKPEFMRWLAGQDFDDRVAAVLCGENA